MKKKMMLSLCAAAGAVLMSAGAFAGEVTVEEILQNYAAAGKQPISAVCDADIKADIKIDLPDMDMNMGIGADGQMNMAFSTEPLAVASTGTFAVDAMGEQQNIDMNMYVVTDEDGSLGSYVNMVQGGEETGWQYDGIPAEDAEALMQMIKGMDFDLTQLPINWVLADGTVEAEGHECYEITASVSGPEIIELVKSVAAMFTEAAAASTGEEIPEIPVEELDQVAPLVEGIVLNMTMDLDTESSLPIHFRLDMDGTDWTILSAVFAQYAGMTNDDGSLMNVQITVPELYIDYVYDYDAPVEITVPEEALAAKANGSTFNAEELMSEISAG